MSVRRDRELAALAAAGWSVHTETIGQRLAAGLVGLVARAAGWSR